ncbi:MAG: DUF2937 family protein, partial [Pseudomonadota bacterium]
MIVNLFDKLIFACAFIVSLQLPQLSDHYQQHLAGLYHATKWQVDGYAKTAKQYNFSSTQAMINRHLANAEPSVRPACPNRAAPGVPRTGRLNFRHA